MNRWFQSDKQYVRLDEIEITSVIMTYMKIDLVMRIYIQSIKVSNEIWFSFRLITLQKYHSNTEFINQIIIFAIQWKPT